MRYSENKKALIALNAHNKNRVTRFLLGWGSVRLINDRLALPRVNSVSTSTSTFTADCYLHLRH